VHDKVVSWGKGSGNGGWAGFSGKGISGLGPLAVLETVLADLEPFGLLGIKLGAVGVAAGSHVSEFTASVVGPLLAGRSNPVESQRATWLGGSAQSGRLSAWTTVEVGVVSAVAGVDAGDLTDDRVFATFSGVVTLVGLSINFDEVDETVSGNERGEDESESSENRERLHCDCDNKRGGD